VSISSGGSGARHFDFPRRAFGSYESVELSPAKKPCDYFGEAVQERHSQYC
jgi:hypothetical protein